MLGRFLGRGLRLSVGGRVRVFATPSALAAALRSSTGLTSQRITELVRLDDESLAGEASAGQHLAQRLAGVLAQPAARPDPVDAFLADMDLCAVTDDHGWRQVLEALRAPAATGGYRRAALSQYLLYLDATLELLRTLRARRPATSEPKRQPAQENAPHNARARQTLVFDIDQLLPDPGREEFQRLPKGETVIIPMEPHQSLNLVMARYRFLVVSGSPCVLVDDTGQDMRLRPGKNIVGRSSESDVPVDSSYRAVSRKHLIIEAGDDGVVRLTDISTLGTLVPKEYLAKLLH